MQSGDVPFRDPRFRRRPDDVEDLCQPPPSLAVAGGSSPSLSDNIYMMCACEKKEALQKVRGDEPGNRCSRQARRSKGTAHRAKASSRGASSAHGRGPLTAQAPRVPQWQGRGPPTYGGGPSATAEEREHKHVQ